MHVGHLEIRGRLDAAAGLHVGEGAGEGIGVSGIEDQQVTLRHAVDAQGLVVAVRFVPVENSPSPPRGIRFSLSSMSDWISLRTPTLKENLLLTR